MSVTLPYTSLGPGVVDSAVLLANFNVLAAKFATIDNSDIAASGAAISIDKLSASYEYITINLTHVSNGTFPAAGTNLALQPMYNDTKGPWTCASYAWYCQDGGDQLGSIDILWGSYANNVWATTATIVSNELLNGSTAANQNFQDGAASTQALAWTQSAMVLRVAVNTQGTGVMSTAEDKLGVSITLKRQIAT